MDVAFSQKESRMQKGELVDVLVNDVFDMYPIMADDGVTILAVKTVEGHEEILQSATFAAIKQKGSDPLSRNSGVRWEEAMLGEVPPEAVIADIRDAVASVSTSASVEFSTAIASDGTPYLTFDIKVAV